MKLEKEKSSCNFSGWGQFIMEYILLRKKAAFPLERKTGNIQMSFY